MPAGNPNLSWRFPSTRPPHSVRSTSSAAASTSGFLTLESHVHGSLGAKDAQVRRRHSTPATWALRCADSPETTERRVCPPGTIRAYHRFVKPHMPHAFRSRDTRNVNTLPSHTARDEGIPHTPPARILQRRRTPTCRHARLRPAHLRSFSAAPVLFATHS